MQITHKIELKPNNKQKTYFRKACGTSRFCYNWALNRWQEQYQAGQKPSGMSLKKEFNAIKKKEFPWTAEVTKYAAQQPFLDLQDAFRRFFKKLGGKPKFKKKSLNKDSFYVGGDQTYVEGEKIYVPRLGLVRLKEKLKYDGKINSVVISRTADRWFASVQVEMESLNLKKPIKDRAFGVDVGLNHMIVTSDGHAIEALKPLKKRLRRLRRMQRVLDKMRRVAKKNKIKLTDAKNYQKQKMKVARLHATISNIRKDALHKTTTFLANNYSHIALEDLNVKGMVKNHNLARHIQDVGFGELRRQIEYKTKWRETNLVLVDRFYPSSKTCSRCGTVKENLSLSERIFNCDFCSHAQDRDLNAAINIKNQIGRVPPESTPVEITAMRKAVYPLLVTSIAESGNKHQTRVSRSG